MSYLICFVAQITYSSDLIETPFVFTPLDTHLKLDARWLSFINNTLPIYGLFNMLASIPLFIILEKRWARVIFFLLTTSVLFIHFAHSPGHNMHLIVWALFFGILIPGNDMSSQKSLSSLRLYIRAMQIQILLIYAIAGTWKIFYFLKSFLDPNLAAGKYFLSYSIAHEFINTGHVSLFSSALFHSPAILSLLSVGAFLTQALSLFVIFLPRLYPFWGVLLALFHVGTLVILNVFFVWPIFFSLLFLTIASHTKDDSYKT